MLTHIEVATRAKAFFSFNGFQQFSELIEKYPAEYQAGATFPDWGYPRNGYHQASEDAHWPPFYLAAANYIQKRYDQPWSEDAERLIVFLTGATTHMVADVAWHSLLNVSQGFIQAMSCVGWSCDYTAAHHIADLGGDTVLAVQNDLSYILTNWSIPLRDIAEIYHLIGWDNVTEIVLTESMIEMYAGTMALRFGGAEVLYPKYNSVPGFLADQFEGYFIGGLDDMAVWTTYCWPYVMTWFLRGPGENPAICMMMSPAMPPATTSSFVVRQVPSWRFVPFPEELNEPKMKIMKELIAQESDGHLRLSSTPSKDRKIEHKEFVDAPSAGQRFVIYSANNYSYFGYDSVVADLNGDSYDDVILSAPGYSDAASGKPQMGCVFFLFGSPNFSIPVLAGIETIADLTLCGDESHDRFGHALSVLDLNKDGILDVAISSPTINSIQMQYQGKVNVFFGNISQYAWTTNSQSNLTIFGSFYSNFGFTHITGDVNSDGYDDLIVGSPFGPLPDLGWNEVGSVSIFLASASYKSGQQTNIGSADFFLNPPMTSSTGAGDHAWFGSSLAFVAGRPGNSEAYLIVGAPANSFSARGVTAQQGGSVTIYIMEGGVLRPLALFYGDVFSQLGAQIAVGSMPDIDESGPVIAITLPLVNTTVPQAGKVVLISFNEILKFVNTLNSTNSILPFTAIASLVATSLNGDQEFARFGSALAFVDFTQKNQPTKASFFVGYPLWTFDSLEQGIALMWETGRLPHGQIDHPVFSVSRAYTISQTPGVVIQKDARFGNSISFGDINGDGNTDIAIGSFRRSLHSYLGGAVEICLN